MTSSRFLTKKVFRVEDLSAAPAREKFSVASLGRPKFCKGAATRRLALHAALRRSPAAGQLSGHARRRVFALWLRTGRGLGAQQAAAIWRTVTVSEALATIKARWARQYSVALPRAKVNYRIELLTVTCNSRYIDIF